MTRTDHMSQHAPPAWDDSRLRDPHHQPDKADRVRGMFAAIAPRYDLNNRLHSLGRDQAWRRTAVRLAHVAPGDRVLDVACGTGDLTQLFARSPAREVVGVDFTPAMLDLAAVKRARLGTPIASKISYEVGDAMNLRFDDASFDVVSIAFGIRNVQQPERALEEFARVLRPAGRLVILEFTTPRFPPIRWLNAIYSGVIMPRTATWISRDRSGAYRYLPKSVATFQSAAQLVRAMEDAGFQSVRTKPLTMGICACYRGIRP